MGRVCNFTNVSVTFMPGLPIGLSVHQSVLPAGPALGPAWAPQGSPGAAEGSKPAPVGQDLWSASLPSQGGTQASLSLSTGALPSSGVTATASGTLGGTTTTAGKFRTCAFASISSFFFFFFPFAVSWLCRGLLGGPVVCGLCKTYPCGKVFEQLKSMCSFFG
jgi:hypothetical protein